MELEEGFKSFYELVMNQNEGVPYARLDDIEILKLKIQHLESFLLRREEFLSNDYFIVSKDNALEKMENELRACREILKSILEEKDS